MGKLSRMTTAKNISKISRFGNTPSKTPLILILGCNIKINGLAVEETIDSLLFFFEVQICFYQKKIEPLNFERIVSMHWPLGRPLIFFFNPRNKINALCEHDPISQGTFSWIKSWCSSGECC